VRFYAWFAVLAAAAGAVRAAEDPREIVRRSIETDRHNAKLSENYTFIEREDQQQLDSQGRVKRRILETYDITLTEGSPYRRLVGRDDKPLSPDEERKEQSKLDKSIVQRRAETPEQRAKRLDKWRKERDRERAFLREMLDAFDFRLAGEETLNGRPVYVVDGTPKPGYRPKTREARFLPKLKGRLWIDAEGYNWVKMEAEVTDTITFYGIAARVAAGTRLFLEQVKVNDEVWLPQRISIKAQARVFLVKKINGEWDISFRDYKKFQSDSRILTMEEEKR
jgi:hypothetical protein